jgi:hypothetical protein
VVIFTTIKLFMKRILILCLFLSGLCYGAPEQKIVLKEIYRRIITPDYTRYEYVFSLTNSEPHRLDLLIIVNFLGPDGKVLDNRFLYFGTLADATELASVESDWGPMVPGPNGASACSYRLHVRDGEREQTYELEGNLNVPVTPKRG